MSELESLNQRLKAVIIETCNVVGCKECDLKWEGGCSATELQGQILDIEIGGDQ